MSSNSFSYQKHSGRDRCATINEEESAKDPKSGANKRKSGTPRKSQVGTVDYSSPVRSELQVKPSKDDDDMVTLVHTVSFYRRQQQQNSMTPRKVPRTPVSTKMAATNSSPRAATVDSTTADDSDEQEDVSSTAESTSTGTEEGEFLVQEKVKKLLDEVCKQQTIIAQASQALNLCAATIEFSGSTESAEGERHLLVASKFKKKQKIFTDSYLHMKQYFLSSLKHTVDRPFWTKYNGCALRAACDRRVLPPRRAV